MHQSGSVSLCRSAISVLVATALYSPIALASTVEYGETVDGVVLEKDIQLVYGTANNTKINPGGEQHIKEFGISSNTEINGGYQYIEMNGTAEYSVLNDGYQIVQMGGAANQTTLNNGVLQVYGAANDPTIKGGRLIVEKDGITVLAAIEKGGLLEVKDGGLAFAVDQKAGGAIKASTRVMEVFGTNRLGQFEIKNGIANNMLLENGGSLRVEENDFAYNTTVDSGGLLEVMDGGTATGVDKKAGGKLIVSTNALEVSGTNSKGQFSIKDGVSKNYELDDGSGLIVMEDTQAIARYGRNVTKMDAFGCTSRGQAHRAGLWLIKTELLETQTVDFSVGAEGLRHVPGDVIEICDDDYAGISIGGRVLAVNSQTRTLTLDREITLPSSGTTLISLVDGEGNPVSVEVQSVTDGVKVKVSRVPDGVAEYSVWGLKLPTLRQRLFRCVSIRENDDGTYAITAVQHVPEKEAIVDNGAYFDGDQSGTVNGVTPPAVQHLTAEVTADSGEYQVLARWDTPKVVKGVSFLLRLTVTADDGSERLVSTARTTETTYRFRQLALGRYTLTVRAVNARGQQGDPASVSFRIAAPAAPSRIELTPGYFQITATPHLAVYDPTVQFEFWFSETRITDIRQVETTARYLGTGLYWIAASINIKPGHDYYFYIRSVNTVGKSAFVEAVGRASDDAEGYLDFFKGKITESHLGKELLEKVDLTEDNASRLDEFSKEWKDANDKWNAMWGVKIEQTKDGKHYVAGIGLSMEDTEEGKLSQFLVAANRIAFIDPANGNETPMFVAQGNQIFMNDVFLKRLTAPTITSGGSPPVFSLTSDGKLTAKNADISGSVNANSGTLNNVTVNENCTIKGHAGGDPGQRGFR